MKVVAEFFEIVTVELFVIVRYDGVGYPVPVDNILIHKFFDFSRHDGHECFSFDTFGEVVDRYHYVLYATSSFRELANQVNSLYREWPQAGRDSELLGMCFGD